MSEHDKPNYSSAIMLVITALLVVAFFAALGFYMQSRLIHDLQHRVGQLEQKR